MKLALIFIALCAYSTGASATNDAENQPSQWHVMAHGFSHHAKPRGNGQEWNEVNIGLGLRYQINSDWGIQGGAFKNSLSKTSVYALAQYTPLEVLSVRGGAFAGYISGYPQTQVAAGFMALKQWNSASVIVRHVPEVKGISTRTTSIEFGWRF